MRRPIIPAFLSILVAAQLAVAQATTAPAVPPAAAAGGPSIAPEAKELLSQLDSAYRNLTNATFSGTVSTDIDIAGQKDQQTRPFTAAFSSDKLRFRHETPDEILVGSTGESLYAYRPVPNAYVMKPAPTERLAIPELAQPFQMILRTQNPSLMLALSNDPAGELTRNVTSVTRGAELSLAGTAYPTLVLSSADGTVVTVAVDTKTHLIRHVRFDLKKVAEARNAPNVKSALLSNDYGTITLGDSALPAFAWSAPVGAKDEAAAAANPDQQMMQDPATALENKAAPAFTLKNEEDKEVKLSELKGSVVILDFWATWCPPCREGLPVLDELAKANNSIKVVAVNLREDKDTVSKFKKATALGLPVLFDSEGSVAELYKVTGIPQTVVIDKTGTVRKVIVGFDPAEKATLQKLVDSLNK